MTSGPSACAIFRIVFASGTSPASMRVNIRYTKLARTSRSRSSYVQSNRVLQNQHPDDDLRRRARTAAPSTLRPTSFEALRDDLNHGFVLEQDVDFSQPVGPQFVPIGQQHFEQTALALSSLNHARSFDERSRAGSVVRQIDRRNCRIERLVTAGRGPSVPVSELRGHFFTAE